MNTIHIDPKDAVTIIRATFPGYSGKQVKVTAAESVTIHNLNWSGGSRSQYRACTMDGKPTGGANAGNSAPPWGNPYEGKEVPIPQGFVVVEHCTFCGKDHGLTIFVHPADMPKYLPSGSPNLTPTERKVLVIIRSLISSYRREEAQREGISPAAYESTLATLKEKGLLNKSGALTLEGKNVAGSLR